MGMAHHSRSRQQLTRPVVNVAMAGFVNTDGQAFATWAVCPLLCAKRPVLPDTRTGGTMPRRRFHLVVARDSLLSIMMAGQWTAVFKLAFLPVSTVTWPSLTWMRVRKQLMSMPVDLLVSELIAK